MKKFNYDLLKIEIIDCGILIFKFIFNNNVPKDIKSLHLKDFEDMKLVTINHLDHTNPELLHSFIDKNVIYIYMRPTVSLRSNLSHENVFKFFKETYCGNNRREYIYPPTP